MVFVGLGPRVGVGTASAPPSHHVDVKPLVMSALRVVLVVTGRRPRVPRCFNCQQEGHIAAECPTPADAAATSVRKCHNCGSEDHLRRDCPEGKTFSRAPAPAGGSRDVQCFICNEYGHTRYGPTLRRAPSSSPVHAGVGACVFTSLFLPRALQP